MSDIPNRSDDYASADASVREAYLDSAATSRPRPEVIEVMRQAFEEEYGNASSLHAAGRRAKRILESSRESIAAALGVDSDEVYFTSGGTESNNLAVHGACRARGKDAGRIITSALEHASVTRSVRGLKREGWKVSYVDAVAGDFDLDSCRRFFKEGAQLASVMAVQNELGYRMPVGEVCALRDAYAPDALVHTDAVQALGKVPLPLREWGVDLASFSAHKIGGPKGIGALYVKRGTRMFTTAFGGGQERGLRSGTEPVFLIAGFAEAVRQAFASMEEEGRRVRGLWESLVEQLGCAIPSAIVNSRADGSAFICNFSIPGMPNQAALEYLSDRGIYVSKASACESNHETVAPGTWRPKHPLSLQAAGIPLALGRNTLRISFGHDTLQEDVDRLVAVLAEFMRGMQGEHPFASSE